MVKCYSQWKAVIVFWKAIFENEFFFPNRSVLLLKLIGTDVYFRMDRHLLKNAVLSSSRVIFFQNNIKTNFEISGWMERRLLYENVLRFLPIPHLSCRTRPPRKVGTSFWTLSTRNLCLPGYYFITLPIIFITNQPNMLVLYYVLLLFITSCQIIRERLDNKIYFRTTSSWTVMKRKQVYMKSHSYQSLFPMAWRMTSRTISTLWC